MRFFTAFLALICPLCPLCIATRIFPNFKFAHKAARIKASCPFCRAYARFKSKNKSSF